MSIYIGLLLFLLSWLQPLHIGPWISWHSEVLATLATFVLVWGGYFRTPGRYVQLPILVAIPLFICTLVWGQSWLGIVEYRGDAIVGSIYLVLFAGAIFSGYSLSGGRHTQYLACKEAPLLSGLTGVLIIGAILCVALATMQLYRIHEGAPWVVPVDIYRRPGSNFAQVNHFGTLVVMGLVANICCFAQRKIRWFLFILLQLLFCWGVIIAESRTALLAGGLVMMWVLIKNKIIGPLRSLEVVFATILAYIAMAYLYAVSAPDVLLDASNIKPIASSRVFTQMTDVGLRAEVWLQLARSILERPLVGWGFLGGGAALLSSLDGSQISGPFTYSHNILIDFFIWFGIPSAVILVAVIAMGIAVRVKSVTSIELWFCWAFVVPFGVHVMLEFPHAYAYFLFPVGLVLGCQEALVKARWVLNVRKEAIVFIYVLMSVLCGRTLYEYSLLEEDYRVARAEALRIGPIPSGYAVPEVIVLDQLSALMSATRLNPHLNMNPVELIELRKTAQKYPWSAIQNRYALSLALNGRVSEAELELSRICSMHGYAFIEKLKVQWLAWAEKYNALREVRFVGLCGKSDSIKLRQ